MSDDQKPIVRLLERCDSGAAELFEEMHSMADKLEAVMVLALTSDGHPIIRSNKMTDQERYYLIGVLNAYAAQTLPLFAPDDDGDDVA